MSLVGVSPSQIKYHANYLIATDGIYTPMRYYHIRDLTCHNKYLFINTTCNICQDTIYLHSSKLKMRYNPEKIVTYGSK